MDHLEQIGQITGQLTLAANDSAAAENGTRKPSQYFTGEQIVAILKRHLVDHEKVSDLCRELDIAVNQFYRWQKEFFDRGAAAFDQKSSKRENARIRKLEERNSFLEARLAKKDGVIAEAVEEISKLKKSLGEL